MLPRSRRGLAAFAFLTIAGLVGTSFGGHDAKVPRIEEVETLLLDGTNACRQSAGRERLKAEPKLTKTARDFAAFMAKTDKYGHQADGKEPSDRVKEHGYTYCVIAENIAYEFSSEGFGTRELADKLLEGWKNSPGHRKNMLDPDVTETGIGVAHSENSNKYYAVQVFGRPRSAAIEFSVANETQDTVEYTLDGEKLSLPGRTTRTHEVCRPGTLTLPWQKKDGKSESIRPRNGDHFEVTREGDQLRLRRASSQGGVGRRHRLVERPFLDLFLQVLSLGGQAADLADVRQIDAGADQPAGVHQDAEAEHRKRPAGMAHQLAELVADLLAQPQGAEG
jgi:hypothetical protein